jgi:hypothetical protein
MNTQIVAIRWEETIGLWGATDQKITVKQFPSLNESRKPPRCWGRGWGSNSRSAVAQTVVNAVGLPERHLEDIRLCSRNGKQRTLRIAGKLACRIQCDDSG